MHPLFLIVLAAIGFAWYRFQSLGENDDEPVEIFGIPTTASQRRIGLICGNNIFLF